MYFLKCLGIWCRHEIWISKIQNYDLLESEKSFNVK